MRDAEQPAAMTAPADLQLFALRGMPRIGTGDDIAAELLHALQRSGLALVDGDIIAIAQKIVSKAEGRAVRLADVEPSARARELGTKTGKDPRLVELILRESVEIVRRRGGVLITRTRLGFVQANAGIDQSNVDGGGQVLLLPVDPDASAARMRSEIAVRSGRRVGILVIDSMNRPWRLGTTGAVIGCSGVRVLDDRRGSPDLYGRRLEVTVSNPADGLAAAANLLMGEADEGVPAVLIRGVPSGDETQIARDIVRPLEDDLFR
jgi:coenzyme F420-0:L-glutamate ligase/coenzyme F420-1:gamma-L-glutamate ligase